MNEDLRASLEGLVIWFDRFKKRAERHNNSLYELDFECRINGDDGSWTVDAKSLEEAVNVVREKLGMKNPNEPKKEPPEKKGLMIEL